MSLLKPWAPLLLTTMVTASGCDELPLLEVNVCGNRVVEPDHSEDCDGLSAEQQAAGLVCRGAEQARHACRWDCSASACPPGFGCGADGICRRPSGGFEAIHSEATSPTTGYLIADLNGDGCGELVRTSRGGYGILSLPSPAGEAYEGISCPGYSQAIPFRPDMASTALPVAGLLGEDGSEGNEAGGGGSGTAPAGDQRAALIIPAVGNAGDGLFTFFAGSEPELMPLLYLNVPLPSSQVRAVAVGLGDGSAGFVLLSGPAVGDGPPGDGPPGDGAGDEPPQCLNPPEPGRSWLYGTTKPQNGIEPLGPPDTELNPDDIVALTAADLDADGCEEVLFALAGTSEVHILSPCDVADPDTLLFCSGDLSDRFAAQVHLPPGAEFSQPTKNGRVTLQVIDHNGDGYLDLLIGPGSVEQYVGEPDDPQIPVHIAYGLGDRRFHSQLDQLSDVLSGAPPPDQLASPLAPPVVEAPVVVSRGNIFVVGRFAEDSSQPPEIQEVICPPAPDFVAAACTNVATACSAVVVDPDRDGHLDIVSAEPNMPDLDYAKGDGTGAFSHFTIPTSCPPVNLVSGDFDGDQLVDVAYFDRVLDEDDVTSWMTLSVLYGHPSPHDLEVKSFGRFPVEQDKARDLAAGRMAVWHPTGPGGEDDKEVPTIDTLAAIAPAFEVGGATQAGSGTALGLVEGQTDRLLYAPYYFPGDPPRLLATLKIVGLARGSFTAPGSGSLAVLTAEGGPLNDAVALWLLEAANEANSLTRSGEQLSLEDPELCYELNPAQNSNDDTPLRCLLAALNAHHEDDVDGDGDRADDQLDELVIFGLNGKIAVYRAGSAGAGFGSEPLVQATSYRFVAYDNGNPIGHNRPPAVADLDGDGSQDVVLPSQEALQGEGQEDKITWQYTLIGLWGDGSGGFEVVPLTREPAEPELGSQLTYSHQPGYALLNVDLDAAPELAVIEAGEVIFYDFDPSSRGRLIELFRISPPHLPQDKAYTFASAAAGDVDGDGVDDLVVAGSENEHVVLRGKPERD